MTEAAHRRYMKWFAVLAGLFAFSYLVGLGAWCYDEASYGGQPLHDPPMFIALCFLCAYFARKLWRDA